MTKPKPFLPKRRSAFPSSIASPVPGRAKAASSSGAKTTPSFTKVLPAFPTTGSTTDSAACRAGAITAAGDLVRCRRCSHTQRPFRLAGAAGARFLHAHGGRTERRHRRSSFAGLARRCAANQYSRTWAGARLVSFIPAKRGADRRCDIVRRAMPEAPPRYVR